MRILQELGGRSEAQLTDLIRLHDRCRNLPRFSAAMDLVRTRFSEAASPTTIRELQAEGDVEYIIRRHRALYQEEYNLNGSLLRIRGSKTCSSWRKTSIPSRECILIPELERKTHGQHRHREVRRRNRAAALLPAGTGGAWAWGLATGLCRRGAGFLPQGRVQARVSDYDRPSDIRAGHLQKQGFHTDGFAAEHRMAGSTRCKSAGRWNCNTCPVPQHQPS